MKAWYGELPSGEVVHSRRGDVIMNGVYYRYERRDGQMYSVGYTMTATDDPERFLLEEHHAQRWTGVL